VISEQIGVFSRTFARPAIDAVLDVICAHGLSNVHFNFSSAGLTSLPDAIGRELCDEIREKFEDRRLVMTSVSATFNAIHPDVRQRELDIRRACGIIESCPRIGAPMASLCSGTRDPQDMWKRHAANDLPDAWADLLATLGRLLPVAEAAAVTLGIEPEHNNVVNSAEKARRLLDELRSPSLRIILDGANLFDGTEPPAQADVLSRAVDLLGSDIVLAHAKDIPHPARPSYAAGRGLLDWSTYLGVLNKSGYGGPLVLHGLREDEVPGSIQFLKDKLNAIY
jgi:sugar phosphate isomerase/epimerase